MKKFFLFIALCLFAWSCNDSIDDFQEHNFIKYFSSGDNSRGLDVATLPDGGYIITGYDTINGNDAQILVARTDKYGNAVWNNLYGSSEAEEEGRLVKAFDGGYIILGSSVNDTIPSVRRAFILQLSEDGDSLLYKEFGRDNESIIVHDFLVMDTSIIVVGEKAMPGETRNGNYISELSFSGEEIDRNTDVSANTGSFIRRVFLQNAALIYVGYNPIKEEIQIVKPSEELSSSPVNNESLSAGKLKDAIVYNEYMYLLSDVSGQLKIIKSDLNANTTWSIEIDNLSGMTIIRLLDGTFIVFGQRELTEGEKSIYPLRVYDDGTYESDSDYFRPIEGTLTSAKPTIDGGLIFTGSTNATFVQKAQLVKTGSGLFLLKP